MGLNFQTCTLVNSNLDPDSNNKVLFETIKTKVDGVEVDAFKVKRDFLFVKDNVCIIRKRAGYEAKACEATIDFAELMSEIKPEKGNNYCRLDMYVKYEGAEPFYGANPMHVQKGIPFWVEFTVSASDSASKLAEKVYKQIKKDHLFLIDKDIVNITLDGSALIFEGATEFQRFEKIDLSMFGASDDFSDKVSGLNGIGITLNERGYNSFGTYSQIIKDLRLPTAANYQWTHLRQVETPIVGAIYNQYIIEYCAPASNEGTQFVGHRGMSHTTHVFWVKNDTELIGEWESALSQIGKIETVCCEGEIESGVTVSEVTPEVTPEVTE